MGAVRWPVEHPDGTIAERHARMPEAMARAVHVQAIDRPTLVVGSAQRILPESGDLDRFGLDLVRRRSGGSAVLLQAGDVCWIDVVLPRDDPLWSDDVGRSTLWLGEAWVAALAECGIAAAVHRGALVRSPWSATVCFAGLASGEVTVDGCKVVGISQRRTRSGARFQCAALLRWDPSPLVELFRLPDHARVELAGVAAGLPVPAGRLVDALTGCLADLAD